MYSLRKVYLKLNKLSDYVIKVVGVFVAAMVILSIGVVMLQVINRYVIVKVSNFNFKFTEELSRYLMIWCAYCTVFMCCREGSMPRVDVFYAKLGKRSRLIMYLLTCLMTFVFYVIVIRYGIYYASVMRAFKTSVLKWPGNVVYLAPVVGAVLMAAESVIELIGVLSGELEPFTAGKSRTMPWHDGVQREETK